MGSPVQVGNYTQAELQNLFEIAWQNSQASIEVANIGAGASRYSADIQAMIAKMQLAYSYYRLKTLELPQAIASDDLARHQLAINAATQFAQLSGWINPMDFDTRRIFEHAMNQTGQQINNAPVSADQMLASADMKAIQAEAKANGWGDADAEAILTVWVQNNDGNEQVQQTVDKAKRILETDMATYKVDAEKGDLYAQQKMVKNAYYVNKMNLTPQNMNPEQTRQEAQAMIDEYVKIPQTKQEMIPFSKATPEMLKQMQQGTQTPAPATPTTPPPQLTAQPQQQQGPQIMSTKQMLEAQGPPQFNAQSLPTTQSNMNQAPLPQNLEKPPVWG